MSRFTRACKHVSVVEVNDRIIVSNRYKTVEVPKARLIALVTDARGVRIYVEGLEKPLVIYDT